MKQYGIRMVQDHQKAQQEIRQLATKEGVLSGKEFDRAYITLMMRDHTKDMKHCGQHALVEPNQEIRQWTTALPVIKEHRGKVKTMASALGIDPALAPSLSPIRT